MKRVYRVLPRIIALMILCQLGVMASAREYRAGGSLGFGGTGMRKLASVENGERVVERAEGPGILSLFVETLVSDYWSLGLEHTRGFRLGPFSSGVSFTGITGRYYFLQPAPSMISTFSDQSTLLVKQFSYFVGGGTGVGQGKITRDADQVLNVSGSGVYIGIKVGADVPMRSDVVLRPELIFNTTFFATEVTAPTLTEFALQISALFPL